MHLINIKLITATAAVLFAVAGHRATAQSTPDIVWQTNAHASRVSSLSFAVDGSTLITGSQDTTIKLWRVSDGQNIRTLRGHRSTVTVLTCSPDGITLSSGNARSDDDFNIKFWDLSTGALLSELDTYNQGEDPVNDAAFSPNGQIFAYSEGDDLQLLRMSDWGTLFHTDHYDIPYSIAFSPCGRYLASSHSDYELPKIVIRSVPDGREVSPLFLGHTDVIHSLAFVPSGDILLSGSADRTIKFWHMPDGNLVRTLSGDLDTVFSVKPSIDGKTLLSASRDNTIGFWRVRDGSLLQSYRDPLGVTALAVSPSGQHFAYGRADGVAVLARMPVVVEETRQDDQIILHWTGGSGLYRIQRRNDLMRGVWHNFGPPTTATSFTNEINREPIFYRVVSLPNAP